MANGNTFVVVCVVHVVGLHEHCTKYNKSVIITKRFVLNVDLALAVGGSYGKIGQRNQSVITSRFKLNLKQQSGEIFTVRAARASK